MNSELIVQGGLGNQLFILLEAYRLKLSLNHCVMLNLTEYDSTKRPNRLFGAAQFLPQILTDFKVSVGLIASMRYIFAKLCSRFQNRKVSTLRLPGDIPFSYSTLSRRHVHIGYYQNISATSGYTIALARMKTNFSLANPSSYTNRLAVHVRRGDYLLLKHSMHGLVQITDLIAESRIALSKYCFEGITVFTDSPELLDITLFESLGVDVMVAEGGNPSDVLTRMAYHTGIIASNSSFSLWAGLLGEPLYFSLPQFWMPSIESTRLGLNSVRRYPCTL